MPTLGELVSARTSLGDDDLDWLHRLVADWQLLADLSFADLMLWVPVRGGAGFLAVAQMRPTTGPTVHLDDRVGVEVDADRHTSLRTAWTERRIYREGDPDWRDGTPVREEAIPVVRAGVPIAVVTRETDLKAARTPSRLDIAYLECAADLASMVCEGRFPFPAPAPEQLTAEPRVGDGLIRLDAQGRVLFASPNALSAYRRLGLAGDLVGGLLSAVTADLGGAAGGTASAVAEGQAARSGELDVRGTVVQLRAIPLLRSGTRIGAIVLVHDISELRRRDRQLLGKDATIREIHHRVKNNLQTVAALLRLQSRRLAVPEGRAALEESVRRVSSIALVHETLSQTLDESVAFDEVADRIIRMVGDVGVVAGGVVITRSGSFGVLPAAVATSMAMVLTELLQNAVEHGFDGRSGTVSVTAELSPNGLRLRVRDDGSGLPPGFDIHASNRLGLHIVRTLVTTELGGAITLHARRVGTEAIVDVPAPTLGTWSAAPPGTATAAY